MSSPLTLWERHGPVRVSAHAHFLEHADGTTFLWLGDTAWDLLSLAPEDVKRSYADRAARGVSLIQMQVPLHGGLNGALALPQAPGWGVELDWDYVEKQAHRDVRLAL